MHSQNCGAWALRYTFAISRLRTGYVAAWFLAAIKPGLVFFGVEYSVRMPVKVELILHFAAFLVAQEFSQIPVAAR